jgi:hypothetical protein
MLLSAIYMSGSRVAMRLMNSQMPNLADTRRPFQDEIGDLLGKKGARNVRGQVFDRLRQNAADVVAGRAREAVPITDQIAAATPQISSLGSRTSSLNCHPSNGISMRPSSSHSTRRPSMTTHGLRESSSPSHSILPRTVSSTICNPRSLSLTLATASKRRIFSISFPSKTN